MVLIKTKREIDFIRESSKIVSDVLKLLERYIVPGTKTKELDDMVEDFIRSAGGEPAFKGYGNDKRNLFPASICVSIDDVVVHGIPDGRALIEGEIVSVDVGVKKNRYYGDGARTYAVGSISEEKDRLMRVTEEALYKGIDHAVEGNHLYDISSAVQQEVEAAGFSVVRDLVGHGIGKSLHEEPPVPNFVPKGGNRKGMRLREGMTLAIEPMVNYGTEQVRVGGDGWTVRTSDGKPSAHFEHTIVVRENEAEILTV
ncbi:MAG: type I methionyl aminopeptidase [Bacteroidota bacterium]